MVRAAVDLAALVALPPAERLALVQALWDSLRVEPGALPIIATERALVARRRADLRRDPDAATAGPPAARTYDSPCAGPHQPAW